MPAKQLLDLCLRLVKFKKENKELLTYLIFEAQDENAYVAGVKQLLEELFAEVNTKNLYIAKKNLRKIIRMANRYIKYSNAAATEVELLIYVCQEIKKLPINLDRSTALKNIYLALLKKIRKAIEGMHEDLQYDYLRELEAL
ncbi:MAG: hypothetical protein JWQ27_546 [Ferruginibacter sp.]|nr:hypothetical protein [Ferruginibacter sp.]